MNIKSGHALKCRRFFGRLEEDLPPFVLLLILEPLKDMKPVDIPCASDIPYSLWCEVQGVFPKLNREEEIWILQSVNKEYTNYTKCLVD